MGLESGSFISALVATNPIGATDPKSQGDDHLRFIKAKLLETFPNINGAVTPTHTELNYVDGVTSAIQTQLNAKQNADADLTAIAGLTTTASTIVMFTGAGTATLLGVGTASGNVPLVGTKSATKILPGLNYDIPQIQPITASVAGNALTVGLGPTTLDFRSTTLTSGTVNTRQVGADISLTVSSGSTLGTVNGKAARLAVLAIDNSGTVELAVVNMAGGTNLDETTLITTTAEGGAGAADSDSIIYSTTARTSVPFRVVGIIDITEATAGTWATAPTTIQGAGGQALMALSSVGYGQTWQAVTRSTGTTYYNTTGRPIIAAWQGTYSSGASTTWTINGVTGIGYCSNAYTSPESNSPSILIPVGASYSLVVGAGTFTSITAHELR